MKESIIITYHKNKDMLLYCLDRILKTTPNEVEILIIGNNINKSELDCIFRKNRALAPHERSAVPLGTDHCPVG